MELLRKRIRSLLGIDSRLYAPGSNALDFMATLWSDGLGVWRTLQRLRYGPPGEPVSVKLRALDHTLWIRPGGDDAFTVLNNAIRQEYGHFAEPAAPAWMIDGGAHIGDTAAYFLSRFPTLRVIALEPNPENYALAKRNLAPYGDRVILLNKALCATDRLAAITGSGVASSLGEEGRQVECTCVPTLLEQYRINRIDILKLDIEGAEDEVLSEVASGWLGRVRLAIVEVHGADIESRVLPVLSSNGFDLSRYRSLWYCLAKPHRPDGRGAR